MKRTFLILSILLIFTGATSTEENQDLNLEGRWVGAYVPVSNEHILDISKKGNEYIFTMIRGNEYVTSGEISIKTDLGFKDCKVQGASKGFKNPYWKDCSFINVGKDLIAVVGEVGFAAIYRDLPEATHSFCTTDWKEKLPESGMETILNMRPKAFQHCLACEGTSCKMKNWPEGREAESLICKKLFCKPTRAIGKSIKSEDVLNVGSGVSQVRFTYKISKKGTVPVLITSKGKIIDERNILGSFKYEPIEIDGEIYEIENLMGWLYWSIDDLD